MGGKDRTEMDGKEMDRKKADRKEDGEKEMDGTGIQGYFREMMEIGLPVTLQCIFQASYGLVDQLMVGRLGTVSIAGSGLGAKFSGLAMVTVSSVAAVASILVAQYHGAGEEEGKSRSFFYCLYIGLLVMLLFLLPSVLVPEKIMGIYSTDLETVVLAGKYLRIVGASFLPMTVTLMVSAYLRSSGRSKPPMYAGLLSMGVNIFLNYIFIFGKIGMPVMGLMGAGYGTLAARSVECAVLVAVMVYYKRRRVVYLVLPGSLDMGFLGKISVIVLPILLNEFSWSIGENIYAAVYGLSLIRQDGDGGFGGNHAFESPDGNVYRDVPRGILGSRRYGRKTAGEERKGGGAESIQIPDESRIRRFRCRGGAAFRSGWAVCAAV